MYTVISHDESTVFFAELKMVLGKVLSVFFTSNYHGRVISPV